MTLPSTMQAAQARAAGAGFRLQIVDKPVPRPAAGQVLVKVAVAGVNHIDLLVARGQVPAAPSADGVIGLEASGTIAALGDGVQGWSPGDRVAWMGALDAACYAQYAVVDAARLARVPDGLALEMAACIPVAATTAMHLIGLAGATPHRRRALVHAATGGVGVLLVQLLCRHGFDVIAATRSESKQALLKSLGAERVVIAGTDGSFPELGQPVDVSFNALGGSSVVRDLDLLAPYGQIVLYGLFAGPPVSAAEAMTAHWHKSTALRTADIFTQYMHRPQAFHAALTEGLALAASGALQTPRGEVAPLHGAEDLLARLEAHGARGKACIRLDESAS